MTVSSSPKLTKVFEYSDLSLDTSVLAWVGSPLSNTIRPIKLLTPIQIGLVGLTVIIFDALNYGIGKDMWNVSVSDAAIFSEVGGSFTQIKTAANMNIAFP